MRIRKQKTNRKYYAHNCENNKGQLYVRGPDKNISDTCVSSFMFRFLILVSCFMLLVSSFWSRAGRPRDPIHSETSITDPPWWLWRHPSTLCIDFSDFLNHKRGIRKTFFLNRRPKHNKSENQSSLAAFGSIFDKC